MIMYTIVLANIFEIVILTVFSLFVGDGYECYCSAHASLQTNFIQAWKTLMSLK